MKNSKLSRRLILGCVMVFFYFPILYMLIFSFNGSRSLTSFDGFSLQWYHKMFNDRNMMEAIYYTLVTAVVATFVSTIVGTITAIGLSKSRRIVREVVQQINDLPIMNPEIVTAVGLMLFYVSLHAGTYRILYAVCDLKCHAEASRAGSQPGRGGYGSGRKTDAGNVEGHCSTDHAGSGIRCAHCLYDVL